MDEITLTPGSVAQDEDVIAALRCLVEKAGSQKQAACVLGVHQKTISDVLKKRVPISFRIAFKLGFLPVWLFTGKGEHQNG
jgi:plasmid maintenance system antidote protein VapI